MAELSKKKKDYSAEKLITGTLELEIEVRQIHTSNLTVQGVGATLEPPARGSGDSPEG